ncbi:MAG: SHOCT domain-containing protein [Candidatus Dormibacteraeota bacterium]|nr:SHOCT domain-containing protein [Candidatus Dormibacteraeota bacterium]
MAIMNHWYVLLITLLFLAGLIALLVWTLRRVGSGRSRDSGLRILEERFARGEIDEQEFKQRKAALRG